MTGYDRRQISSPDERILYIIIIIIVMFAIRQYSVDIRCLSDVNRIYFHSLKQQQYQM